MKPSSAWPITSTSALPTPTTSYSIAGDGSGTARHAIWPGSEAAGPVIASCSVTSSARSASNPYRLPRSVVPSRYTLTLDPDLDAATFAGTVDIEIAVNDPVEHVVLNAVELDIARVTVDGETRS